MPSDFSIPTIMKSLIMQQEIFLLGFLIVLCDYCQTNYGLNLNDFFKYSQNQQVISQNNRFLKFDLVPKLNEQDRFTREPWESIIRTKRRVQPKWKLRQQRQANYQYVWNENGKFWTYRNRFDEESDYFNSDLQNFGNVPCQPPFCLPRRCREIRCGQPNCVNTHRICPKQNVECDVDQKQVMFGSEIVCVKKATDESCTPDCGDFGICVKGKCYCQTGYHGERCSIMDAELCKLKKRIVCTYGCSVDKRINDFNCVCGEKEPKIDCIDLRICAKRCLNGGKCILGKCQCPDGFDGDECQFEIGSCSPGQMGNRTCQQICIGEGRDKFQCTCRPGYNLNDDGKSCNKKECSSNGTLELIGDKCNCKSGWKGDLCNEDIDECSQRQICHHICINTPGSYQCRCMEGFHLQTNGICERICINNCSSKGHCINGLCFCFQGWYGKDCSTDIDECKYNHGCEQLCVNTPGSFHCACSEGNTLQSNKRSCFPNVCQPKCENNGMCNVNNSCICQPGFTGSRCNEDINECSWEIHNCQQKCINTIGSFSCACNKNYRLLSDKKSCEIIPCPVGFSGEDCKTDINECENATICQFQCTNTYGKFYCSCPIGYQLNDDQRSCVLFANHSCRPGFTGDRCDQDIDECTSDQHRCEHLCINEIGSYRCGCFDNYILSNDGRSCRVDLCSRCKNGKCQRDGFCRCNKGFKGKYCEEDFDECKLPFCQHECTNTVGSYRCSCRPGFVLSNDQHSCISVCSLCVNGICDGNGKCICKAGWSGTYCDKDLDECLLPTHNCQQICINTNGSYACSCHPPFQLSTLDRRSCIQVEEKCSKLCLNGGKCVNNKCVCKVGFKGDVCDEDINECQLPFKYHRCIMDCRNTFGSYECLCPPGYVVLDDQKTCKIAPKDTMCKPHCLNGGICRDMSRCYCPSTFEGKDCSQDVNECERYAPCDRQHGICMNTYGSYYCKCANDYVLKFDGVSCITKTEAILNPNLRYRGRGTKGLTVVNDK